MGRPAANDAAGRRGRRRRHRLSTRQLGRSSTCRKHPDHGRPATARPHAWTRGRRARDGAEPPSNPAGLPVPAGFMHDSHPPLPDRTVVLLEARRIHGRAAIRLAPEELQIGMAHHDDFLLPHSRHIIADRVGRLRPRRRTERERCQSDRAVTAAVRARRFFMITAPGATLRRGEDCSRMSRIGRLPRCPPRTGGWHGRPWRATCRP